MANYIEIKNANTNNLNNISLNNLIKKQKTLIVLEHNLQLISQAQWIIDMGLGGGSLGGKVLFQGYPVDLLNNHESYTAEHLKKYVK